MSDQQTEAEPLPFFEEEDSSQLYRAHIQIRELEIALAEANERITQLLHQNLLLRSSLRADQGQRLSRSRSLYGLDSGGQEKYQRMEASVDMVERTVKNLTQRLLQCERDKKTLKQSCTGLQAKNNKLQRDSRALELALKVVGALLKVYSACHQRMQAQSHKTQILSQFVGAIIKIKWRNPSLKRICRRVMIANRLIRSLRELTKPKKDEDRVFGESFPSAVMAKLIKEALQQGTANLESIRAAFYDGRDERRVLRNLVAGRTRVGKQKVRRLGVLQMCEDRREPDANRWGQEVQQLSGRVRKLQFMLNVLVDRERRTKG